MKPLEGDNLDGLLCALCHQAARISRSRDCDDSDLVESSQSRAATGARNLPQGGRSVEVLFVFQPTGSRGARERTRRILGMARNGGRCLCLGGRVRRAECVGAFCRAPTYSRALFLSLLCTSPPMAPPIRVQISRDRRRRRRAPMIIALVTVAEFIPRIGGTWR